MAQRFVIIGGGIAGTTAAEELRKRDDSAEITIIEHESHICYSRVLLPHYVKGVVPREKVFLKKPEWYAQARIELMTNTRVTAVDTKNMFVAIDNGRELPYDALLIATGGEVNLAQDDRRGVSYLHALDDADHLLALLAEVRTLPKEERVAAVYGGGFIALEYINIFAHYGLPTTVVMRGNGFWSRTLSVHAKELLAAHATGKGVTLLMDVQNIALEGEKELTHVVTSDGTRIPARILGVGVGIHTDTTLLSTAGIPHEAGVLASASLETAVRGVYTAGDVAEFDHPLLGRRLQTGNWLNAQMQGRAVAKSMTNEPVTYDLLTSYATNLLGKHVVFIGDTSRGHADDVQAYVVNETSAVDLFMREGRIVGAVMVGDVSERAAITKAIQERRATV